MTEAAERILSEALTLDATERVAIAERLIETIDPSTDPAYLSAWEGEIKARIADIDSGRARMMPVDEAMDAIRRGGGNGEADPD